MIHLFRLWGWQENKSTFIFYDFSRLFVFFQSLSCQKNAKKFPKELERLKRLLFLWLFQKVCTDQIRSYH